MRKSQSLFLTALIVVVAGALAVWGVKCYAAYVMSKDTTLRVDGMRFEIHGKTYEQMGDAPLIQDFYMLQLKEVKTP